jgi:hypothetical protein
MRKQKPGGEALEAEWVKCEPATACGFPKGSLLLVLFFENSGFGHE